MRRRAAFCLASSGCAASLVLLTSTAAAGPGSFSPPGKIANDKHGPPVSGAVQFGDAEFGTGITECPQAGIKPLGQPRPLDQRQIDRVEQISQGGDDQRANFEFNCMPQNEMSIAVNPRNQRNVIATSNDYRLGWGTSGINSSTDNGNNWYGLNAPFPTVPNDDHLDGGGDPVVVFDRAGIAYYASIQFERERADNGIFTRRSTNGGFTWSRPCVPIGGAPESPPPQEGAVCGGVGDPRRAGDGMVTFNPDPDGTNPTADPTVPFDDKEYMTVGPRPAGVEPVCFTAVSRTPTVCPEGSVGVDRLYVTWTRFATGGTFGFTAEIYLSFSDDQGRSWSPPRAISGSAPFCMSGSATPNACDLNQFSTPTVNPATGMLGVAFQNFNTPDENQYLFVRSRDGGVTFEGPFFVTPVFDVNYPRAGAAGGRPDCTARGQQTGRAVLTNSCFRVNSGGNVTADRRGGAFADDFYLTMSDNRNGTQASSNADVFFFRSTDGGTTWLGPTRVNDDPSTAPPDRDCPPFTSDPPEMNPACPPADFGNDQWFPWNDIGDLGDLNVVFQDRRLDRNSVASEWPTSRQRPGNYLSWFWGAQCSLTTTAAVTQASTTIPAGARQCLAPGAEIIAQPTAPVNPGPDPVPGQGQRFLGPFRNFTISDTPSNHDYSFRAGIFMGDYENVDVDHTNQAWAAWTDSRNGRSSRQQAGRNPACEQADLFVDSFSAQSGGTADKPKPTDELFLVTPCPTDIQDRGAGTTP